MIIKQLVGACTVGIVVWVLITLWDVEAEPHIVLGLTVIESTVITESEYDLTIEDFECEFDPPLKHITLIMNYYDSYEALNVDYLEFQNEDTDEIWGWSSCIWQPEDDWAGCDVYLKVPDTVEDKDDDYAIETTGHEVWHAACGDFHE